MSMKERIFLKSMPSEGALVKKGWSCYIGWGVLTVKRGEMVGRIWNVARHIAVRNIRNPFGCMGWIFIPRGRFRISTSFPDRFLVRPTKKMTLHRLEPRLYDLASSELSSRLHLMHHCERGHGEIDARQTIDNLFCIPLQSAMLEGCAEKKEWWLRRRVNKNRYKVQDTGNALFNRDAWEQTSKACCTEVVCFFLC